MIQTNPSEKSSKIDIKIRKKNLRQFFNHSMNQSVSYPTTYCEQKLGEVFVVSSGEFCAHLIKILASAIPKIPLKY